jgi:hypothetical protein
MVLGHSIINVLVEGRVVKTQEASTRETKTQGGWDRETENVRKAVLSWYWVKRYKQRKDQFVRRSVALPPSFCSTLSSRLSSLFIRLKSFSDGFLIIHGIPDYSLRHPRSK